MNNPSNVRSVVSIAALAAVAATAWAMNESTAPTMTYVPPGTYVPLEETVTTPPATLQGEPAAPVEQAELRDTLAPNEIVIAPRVATPVAERYEAQPPVTIEERRLSLDERIQGDVMDAILRTRNLHGKIGVESKDAVVTLSGWTSTPGEAYRAGRAAGAVRDVKYVQNYIRPRIGGSI